MYFCGRYLIKGEDYGNINYFTFISITFLSIFDKSDMENVSDSYIKSLVKEVIL